MERLKGSTVLIVDDEPDLRDMLVFEFEMRGATVASAANGAEALDCMAACEVHAIVSDIRMAGRTGIELLDTVRKRHPSKPAMVLITAYDLDLAPREAYARGVDGIFTKPFVLKDLVACVRRVLTPPEGRWAEPVEAPAESFVCAWNDLDAAVKAGHLALGRGGFAVAGVVPKIGPGDPVGFRLEFADGDISAVAGVGILRWTRFASGGRASAGIEFMSIEETCRESLLARLRENECVPYIPAL